MNPQTAAMFGSAVNWSTARDLYPDAAGPTTAGIGSASTPYTTDASAAGGGVSAQSGTPAATGTTAAPKGLIGQPLSWFVVLIVLFLILGWIGHKIGGREGETGVHNVRLSAYNILFISLAAAIGIGAMKVVFTRINVPGLSTYVQAL